MPPEQNKTENDGGAKESHIMQYVATLVVCLGPVAAGTGLAWTSPVLPQISVNPNANSSNENSTEAAASGELQLTLSQQGWVSSLIAIGAFVGALPSAYIADAIGRRYTALLMDVPCLVAWLVIMFAKSAVMLMVGRFVMGISVGAFCVVGPTYISEIAESSIRGALGICFQLLLTLGVVCVYIVGAVISWRGLSACCLIVPIALFIGMLCMPETPIYLLKKGRGEDAELALKRLRGRNCDLRLTVQQIQTELDSASAKASIVDLFKNRAARRGLITTMLLMFFQQISGINAVIFYTVSIFKSAGSTLNPSICTIIVGIMQFIMTFVASLVIERSGRKALLLIGSISMTFSLITLGFYYHMKDGGEDVSTIGWLPLLCVVIFVMTFSLGYGPVPWLMMGELFLPDFKATAISLTVMTNWFMVFMVTKCFGSMVASWGSDMAFWFFAIFMILATLFVALMVLETKGKSSAEIQAWLGGNK